ncbi:epithelial membrane protein 2-like [Varanus komodoensis]|uniref:epithelial membrane protein 2-like n=1 Tax=Varanus komodoensis TaxID=61221 RepID=UPI001CF7AB22|nr:epithelial membrane protein 2-like [Varanus komodoensis]XP_044274714.1 epithelial membrane protein 2-like [Varanus komodoensis]
MGCLRITAALCSMINLGLLLTALATDYWVTGRFHMGLWNICNWRYECIRIGMDAKDYIHATRAFMVTAALPAAIAFFSLWFSCCCPRIGSLKLAKVAAIASFIAGVCTLLGMATFTGVHSEQYERKMGTWYEWSFGLAWATVPLSLVTGILAYKVPSKTMI